MPELVSYPNHRFQVQIDGQAVGLIIEIILPEARADVVEHAQGVGRHKSRGAIHFSNLVLRRGCSQDQTLSQWWLHGNEGDEVHATREVAVLLLDEMQNPVKHWLIKAWPARYSVAPLIASDNDVILIETMECVPVEFVET
jgi:phage tail-like protein